MVSTEQDLQDFKCKCGEEINVMSRIHGIDIGQAMQERIETGTRLQTINFLLLYELLIKWV